MNGQQKESFRTTGILLGFALLVMCLIICSFSSGNCLDKEADQVKENLTRTYQLQKFSLHKEQRTVSNSSMQFFIFVGNSSSSSETSDNTYVMMSFKNDNDEFQTIKIPVSKVHINTTFGTTTFPSAIIIAPGNT